MMDHHHHIIIPHAPEAAVDSLDTGLDRQLALLMRTYKTAWQRQQIGIITVTWYIDISQRLPPAQPVVQ